MQWHQFRTGEMVGNFNESEICTSGKQDENRNKYIKFFCLKKILKNLRVYRITNKQKYRSSDLLNIFWEVEITPTPGIFSGCRAHWQG